MQAVRRIWSTLRGTAFGITGTGRRLLWVQLATAVCITLATSGVIVTLRGFALDEATDDLHGRAAILADHAERTFQAVELVENAILEHIDADSMTSPQDFRTRMTGRAMHLEMRNRTQALPQLDAITAIDAEGTLLNFSRTWPIPNVNVSDRDYFRQLKANTGQFLAIGKPVQNRGDGSWTIYLARKVVSADGQFLGLVLGALRVGHFENLYRDVAPDPDTVTTLLRRDGTTLAQVPTFPPEPTQDAPLVQEQRLGRYDMAVRVTREQGAALAPFMPGMWVLVVCAILLQGVIMVVLSSLTRQMRQRQLLIESAAARTTAEAELALARGREAAASEMAIAARELEVQHTRFVAALDNMSHALCMFDADDRLVVVNGRLAEMFGLPATAIHIGMGLADILAIGDGAALLAPADADAMRDGLDAFRAASEPSCWLRTLEDGRSLAINYAPVAGGGWLATIEDTTTRHQAEARIAHMAHHDALTGLANRARFHERLGEAIARSRRGEDCAVLCLDLDHFKAVNDTLGHPIGDALLRAVTERLRTQIRDVDTVARLGGDEFAVVQSSAQQPDDSTALAKRLIKTISVPYDIDGHQIVIGTSIGIALVPGDGQDADQVLKAADMALYRAKADGRGRYRFFEPEMDARMQARRALEMDLRKALTLGEFEVFYQPLVSVRTRVVTGFEALVRWRHPIRGLVPPNDFIPLAEEIGLIVQLGEWVLRRACQDAMAWPAHVKVAVNLSAVQFGSRSLVENVAAALADSGLAASRLELEITETVMLEDTSATLKLLHRLRDLGVGIAMDDFGTGYSSLSYLRQFPFSKVKIDKSFIDGLGRGGDCDAIISAVTNLCRQLGMVTTAEGVETQEQLDRLAEGSCTEVQGYLFSRPRPASEVLGLCQRIGATDDPLLTAAE